MPRKSAPTTPFGKRLVRLRTERGLTQTQLAELIDSTQRSISHYETVADAPPAAVLVKLAKVLKVSTDELLGLRPIKRVPAVPQDPETKRLWKKFQMVRELPVKDQRAVIRLINSLVATKQAS